MTLQLLVKQVGKKRPLCRLPMELDSPPATLGELITRMVEKNVADYNSKAVDADLVACLTPEALEAQAQSGKVGFGRRRNERDADPAQAVEAALLAFQDGLYRVFVDREEVTGLEDAPALNENSEIAFVRLTFLAGRLW